MPRKALTSWRSAPNGDLIENDLKLYINEDGSYEIEARNETMGFNLGISQSNKNHTVISRIVDAQKVEKFAGILSVGDLLITVNETNVIDSGLKEVAGILEILANTGYPRRLRFLNHRQHSLEEFMAKLNLQDQQHVDLFGFNCSVEYRLSEKAFTSSNATKTNQRDMEWVDYLKSIGGAENLKPAGRYKPSADLKSIVRRGVPAAYRPLIWQKLSLSSLYRLQYPADYYQQLLARIINEPDCLNQRVKDDIEKDVDRTFPEHIYFSNNGSNGSNDDRHDEAERVSNEGENSLRRVLQAFAVHNPEIGYCQSLNFLAGMMLIFLQEEDAFWLLVTVVEKLLPADYYTKSMVGTYVDQFVLAHIIKKYLPRVHTVLEEHQLQLPLITVQWFMCLFVNTLRPEVTLRVWDIFLNEGSKVLFRIAAALFKLHEPQLLAIKDAGDLFNLLRSIGKDVIDADKLIAAAYKKHSTKSLMYTNKTTTMITTGSNNGTNRSSMDSNRPYSTPRAVSFSFAQDLMRSILPISNASNNNNNTTSSDTRRLSWRSSSHGTATTTTATTSTTTVNTTVNANGSQKKLLISPRLNTQSVKGAVPAEIEGIGLAHTGPADAYLKYRQSSVSYQAATNGEDSTTTIGDESGIDVGTLTTTNSSTNIPSNNDTVNTVTAPALDATAIANVTDSTVVVDPSFGQPEIIMDRVSLSNVNSQLFAETFARKNKKRRQQLLQQHQRSASITSAINNTTSATSNQANNRTSVTRSSRYFNSTAATLSATAGFNELNFYRCDIALWRSSFRPALEDRYKKMELARAQWRSEQKQQIVEETDEELKEDNSTIDATTDTTTSSVDAAATVTISPKKKSGQRESLLAGDILMKEVEIADDLDDDDNEHDPRGKSSVVSSVVRQSLTLLPGIISSSFNTSPMTTPTKTHANNNNNNFYNTSHSASADHHSSSNKEREIRRTSSFASP